MKRLMRRKWMMPVAAAVLGIAMSALAMVATWTGTAAAAKKDGAASAVQATDASGLSIDTSGGCTGDCAACVIACGGILAPAAQIVPSP